LGFAPRWISWGEDEEVLTRSLHGAAKILRLRIEQRSGAA